MQLEKVTKAGNTYKLHFQVNIDQLSDLLDREVSGNVSISQANDLFNEVCDKYGLNKLRSPEGYYKPENNLRQYIIDTMEDLYNDRLDKIYMGRSKGTARAIEAVLGIDAEGEENRKVFLKNVRKNFTNKFNDFLPEGIKYGDLGYITAEGHDNIRDIIDEFALKKVQMTQTASVKRSLGGTKAQRQEIMNDFVEELQSISYQIKAHLTDYLESQLEVREKNLGDIFNDLGRNVDGTKKDIVLEGVYVEHDELVLLPDDLPTASLGLFG